jgi:hypothetical protein
MTDRELLFQAFLAGFDESCEGFNGEYVGERYRLPGALEPRLRRGRGDCSAGGFDEWYSEHVE